VTKRERKLHLCYELRHRVHCSAVYPLLAPNGSTLIVYGHEHGLVIWWRGGRKRKDGTQADGQPNGIKADQVTIHDEEEEAFMRQEQSTQDDYEDQEDELDPDTPYVSIIHRADVNLDAGVLHLAVPSLLASSSLSSASLLKTHAMIAVGLADGTQRIIRVPLAPPDDDTVAQTQESARDSQLALPSGRSICRALAMKVVTNTDDSSTLLVAGASDVLNIAHVSSSGQSLALGRTGLTADLPSPVTQISFTPSTRSAQLLVADVCGSVRLFDPMLGTSSDHGRPSSRDSMRSIPTSINSVGRWLMAYHTSFVPTHLSKAQQKRVLDAAWVMGGKAILVLLEDGEWGIWDVADFSQAGKSPEEFVLRGFLGTANASVPAEPSQTKRSGSKLAPMTPNTRKAKAEDLFTGAPKVYGVSIKGGISVSPNNSRLGTTDESVMMWYHGDMYTIPSFQAFWQRSAAGSGCRPGSLYTPGLIAVTDVDLMKEGITSISQFGGTNSGNSVGPMNTQRDMLISAEHRLIVLQSLRPPTPSAALFAQAAAERPNAQDQRMLDVGDLDIAGMDRMLNSMANDNAKPRRVGFAQ